MSFLYLIVIAGQFITIITIKPIADDFICNQTIYIDSISTNGVLCRTFVLDSPMIHYADTGISSM